MGCKCTKSTESNNLNLQENDNNQPNENQNLENFTENVRIKL